MYKNLYKKSIFYLLNITILFINVYAEEIYQKKEYELKQYLSQIIWEKVKEKIENTQKPLKWKIYKNQNPVNFENNLKENKKDTSNSINNNKEVLRTSTFFLSRGEKIIDYGLINDNFDFYILKLGLTRAFNIDFSSELINSKNNSDNPNKIKNIFFEKGLRNLRGGASFRVFSRTRGRPISTNMRLSYGEQSGGLRHGYIFSEIINKYSMSNWLSFNLNPKFSFTSFGNVYSISSSINWRLNPKFEIIPEGNINLNNAENNFSLTGRTYLSKNIIIDTFVSNSLGVNDMSKQFKTESTQYGVNLKIRL